MAKVGYYYNKSVRNLFLDPEARFILGASGGGGGSVTLTTTGSSGAATLVGTTLNIPDYGSGSVASSRTIATTSPITGGGDLSANRTIAWDFSVANTWSGLQTFTGTNQIKLTNSGAGEATYLYNPGGGASNFASFYVYPATGTNVSQAVNIVTKGTGQSGIKSSLNLWGTDWVAGQTNYEYLGVTATGTTYSILSNKGGTGSYRSIVLDAIGGTSQVTISNTGNVYIGTGGVYGFSLEVTRSVGAGNAAISVANLASNGAGLVLVTGDRASLAAYGGFSHNGSTISGNQFGIAKADYTTLLSFGASTKGLMVGTVSAFPLIFGTSDVERARFFGTGNLAIGTNTDVASAILQLSSTSQGFMPPKMTTAQKNAISSPAEGLLIYDTDLHKLCVRAAAAWETMTSI